MKTQEPNVVSWQRAEVKSPDLEQFIPVIVAKDIPYIDGANRFQNLSLYLPDTPTFSALVGTAVSSLPGLEITSSLPRVHVHVHGGAWRDPLLTSTSIEPTVAHAFSAYGAWSPLTLIASINYTLTHFPTHPTLPYDAIKDNHTDPAREAVHPQHVSDVLHGLARLRSLGLTDGSYLLTGHSCGACLVFQSILQSPAHYGLDYLSDAPCPAAILGLNGLYDLPALVDGLGESHAHMGADYDRFLSNAFGSDKNRWPAASPARFEPATISERVRAGKVPSLVLLDQSTEDQLVPMNQRERLEACLQRVDGLQTVRGHRCVGRHAAPWEGGGIIWESLLDVLTTLEERSEQTA